MRPAGTLCAAVTSPLSIDFGRLHLALGRRANSAPGGDTANLASLIEAQAAGADRMTEAVLSTAGLTNDLLERILAEQRRQPAAIEALMRRVA